MPKFHVFLSKRMKAKDDDPMTKMTWNKHNQIIASGYRSGNVSLYSFVSASDQPGQTSISIAQTIETHKREITAIAWSDNGEYLAIGDKTGKVTFWVQKDTFKQVLTNATVQSKVTSIRWSHSNMHVAIAYEDGNIACVTYDGSLNWPTRISQAVQFLEWQPKDNLLLCGTQYGTILLIDSHGVESGNVPTPCLAKSSSDPKIVAIEWHRHVQFGLMIAFAGGQIQLMRNEADTQPIIVTLDLQLTAACWFRSGQFIAVAALRPSGHPAIIFLTPKGQIVRELELQSQAITSLALDHLDTQLAICVGPIFAFAQIIPSYTWAYAGDTLLYSYSKEDSPINTVIYYNSRTNEKTVHNIKSVKAIGASAPLRSSSQTSNTDTTLISSSLQNTGPIFAIISELPKGEALLSVTDSIGVTLKTTVLSFIPSMISVHGRVVSIADEHCIGVWHFNEEDAPQTLSFQDPINSILLLDKTVIVSSGVQLLVLEIPSLTELSRFSLGFSVENIGCSSDSSTLSLFDSSGTLQFFSLKSGKIVGPARKEVWAAAWASDASNQFAALERHKLFVFNDLVPEEPIQSLSHIAKFTDLEITCVDLIKLMADPLGPSRRLFKTYPTKTLRDLREMMANRPDTRLEDIFAFCKANGNHPRLWNEVAEDAMLEMNFILAERCYLETTNYRGLQFLKRVKTVKEGNLQRAQVLSYLGRFDEAQSIYNAMDRTDLAIEMRKSIGQYEAVVDILGPGGVANDKDTSLAYTNVGDAEAERQNWESAVEAYEYGHAHAKLLKALVMSDNFLGLKKLLDKLPSTSPLLPELGRIFVSLGAVDEAMKAFKACNQIGMAVDAAARLNAWKHALELAGKGGSLEIRARMNRYAKMLVDNGQISTAVDFFTRAGLGLDAAKLLLAEGDRVFAEGDFIKAKQCYVFAGLEVEKHRKGAFDGTVTAAERLDGFMKDDEASSSGLDKQIWRKAEGIHYLVRAHKHLEQKNWMQALYCAARVFEDYSEIVGEERAAAILAVCGLKTQMFGQVSKALTTLETLDKWPQEKREKYEELAIQIFAQNNIRPKDSAKRTEYVRCTKCDSEISMLQSQCSNCGEKMKFCLASGKLIADSEYWECPNCRHRVLIEIAETLNFCPLCHHNIQS